MFVLSIPEAEMDTLPFKIHSMAYCSLDGNHIRFRLRVSVSRKMCSSSFSNLVAAVSIRSSITMEMIIPCIMAGLMDSSFFRFPS
jgi:hypothetical protein